MSRRGSWQGALQILRFNWPMYMFAIGVIIFCIAIWQIPGWPRFFAAAVSAPTLYFTFASLIASHWIYDLSPLVDWRWLPGWLPQPIGRWMLIQAGFDSTYGFLRAQMPAPPAVVMDLYGMPGAGGASVRRAHRGVSAADTVAALPAEPASVDTVLAVFALHEIHTPAGRADFFCALARTLTANGRLMVVEHLRDWKNFLVFGGGFLHFKSEREWQRCAAAASLRLEKQLSITPFVRVFLWRKS